MTELAFFFINKVFHLRFGIFVCIVSLTQRVALVELYLEFRDNGF